ncbi:hypothetical protein PIB30_105557, partial [Stylosanthes scabra]|nr:hypothetical protein [Stylosanthes scabra]
TEMVTRGRGRSTTSTSSGSEPNTIEILAVINTMAAAMRDTAAATNRAVDQINLNGNPNNNVPEDESDGGNGRPMTLATFLKVKPPEFKGTVNVTEADDWFQAMERSLQAQRVPAEQYVEFSTYMLQGEAQHWWAGIRRILQRDN